MIEDNADMHGTLGIMIEKLSVRAHGRQGVDIQAVLGSEGRNVTVRSTAHELLSQGTARKIVIILKISNGIDLGKNCSKRIHQISTHNKKPLTFRRRQHES